MKASVLLVAAILMSPVTPAARQADPQRALLEKMTGHWVLRGVIAKEQTTHDVDAQWVLDKGYIQIHEVSREKEVNGKPKYEALIHVVWDPKVGEFAALWLDTTGIATFPPEGVGHAKPTGDAIHFRFNDPDGGGINTTFAYDRAKDAWSWNIDNDVKGKITSFARVTLTRR